MLRLVSYYTPTHADMFSRFVRQRAWGFDERVFVECGQTCPTGSFKDDGWNDCMLDKLKVLVNLPADNQPTLYVDADVALMPTLVEWCRWYAEHLEDDTVAFSDDVIQWCAGVMLFRTSRRVQSWWQTVADLSVAWDLPDQDAINHLRMQSASRKGGRLPVKVSLLPRDVVCNWATVNAPTVPAAWDGEPFTVPPTCLAWHANWTIGVERKVQMLERVVLGETSNAAPVSA